jgi:hypothetical protein
MENLTEANATALEKEFQWLHDIFFHRVFNHTRKILEADQPICDRIPSPEHGNSDSALTRFIVDHNLTSEERLLLDLALLPHVFPGLIDHFVYLPTSPVPPSLHSQLGIKGRNFSGFIPTGLTWLFLLAGNDIKERIRLQRLVKQDHVFLQESVLSIEPHFKGEPAYSGSIVISLEYLQLFTTGLPLTLIKA